MQNLLSVAWIDRVLQALSEAFHHAIASIDAVSCALSASISQPHWHGLLSALALAGLTLASIAALGTE
jgi:hypothetical protein